MKKKPLSPQAIERRRYFRTALVLIAGFYLATVWLDGVGSNLPSKVLPRPWLFFAQVAALFPAAAPVTIDYRAEGWSCAEHRWTEVDVRPYFPLDAENKENRFQRALQFYRKNRTVMRALDDFIVSRENADGAHRIGGVRFLSLRIPYPAPGEHVSPVEHRAVSSYGKDQRHDWYWTPASRRAERCGDKTNAPSDDDDAAPVSKDPEP